MDLGRGEEGDGGLWGQGRVQGMEGEPAWGPGACCWWWWWGGLQGGRALEHNYLLKHTPLLPLQKDDDTVRP